MELGETHGYRNAQTTVIAPTGTIGLLMDCDTTGVEPDFALVKFKKLAGGGYFKIANQSIEPALKNLGYTIAQIRDILQYVLGTLKLGGAPHINTETLKAKGFTDEELAKAEVCLPTVFELAFAFSPYTFGEATMARLGFTPEQWQSPQFNLLRALGFSKKQIREANDVICGSQTIEGAPHLKPEHLSVFDCANKCGRKGKRFIHHMGHIRMMAAAQPFISGAISKTINLPNEVGVPEIEEAYRESWRLGLKAVALYRDGSKLSQPLNSTADDDAADDAQVDLLKAEAAAVCTTCGDPSPSVSSLANAPVQTEKVVERIIERVVHRPLRRRLPNTRRSITHKFDIGGHEGYITCGLFDDGVPGEVFVVMAKQGSTVGGLMDAVATLVSLNLQHGVPLEDMVRKFEHTRFEPSGMTTNPDIPFAKSVIDYIVRWLAMEFIPGYRQEHAPSRGQTPEPTENGDSIAAPTAAPTGSNGRSPNGVHSNGAGKPQLAATIPHGEHHGTKATAATIKNILETRLNDQVALASGALSAQMATLMGDAPVCKCGSITVRNGSCYKCLNCGESLGCS